MKRRRTIVKDLDNNTNKLVDLSQDLGDLALSIEYMGKIFTANGKFLNVLESDLTELKSDIKEIKLLLETKKHQNHK